MPRKWHYGKAITQDLISDALLVPRGQLAVPKKTTSSFVGFPNFKYKSVRDKPLAKRVLSTQVTNPTTGIKSRHFISGQKSLK